MWELTSFLSLSLSIYELIGMECNIKVSFCSYTLLPWNHWKARQCEDGK